MFTKLVQTLYPLLGDGCNVGAFISTLVDNLMEEPNTEADIQKAENGEYNPFSKVQEATLKQYYNGNRRLPKKQATIILGKMDKAKFTDYIYTFSPDGLTALSSCLRPFGVVATSMDVGEVCFDLLKDALTICTENKKLPANTGKEEFASEFTPSQNEWNLVLEVEGECPECGQSFSHKKDNMSQLRYKVVVIDISKPHSDISNQIAMCPACYDNYIFATTNEDIIRVEKLKAHFVNNSKSKDAMSENKVPIEIQIEEVLNAIEITLESSLTPLRDEQVYEVERKVTESKVLMRKIRGYALDYFDCVETLLKASNRARSQKFRLFQSKVISCYEEAKANETSQETIYNHLVDWLFKQAKHEHRTACEIVIAFFVQICDVFEPEEDEDATSE